MRRLFGLFLILHSALCIAANAATHYVDLNSPGPAAPFSTWATAATNIQDAIDAASPGDTVLVTDGIYATGGRTFAYDPVTNRVVVDKPITLQSVNGPDVTIIQGYQMPTVTNGDSAIRCAYLTDGAAVSGFTFTGGACLIYIYYPGVGVFCVSTNSFISNCVISNNTEKTGYSVVYGGTFLNCRIIENQGSAASRSVLSNCIVTGNSGGGLANCIASACTIVGNQMTNTGGGGGALDSTLYACTVAGNTSSSWGGGGLAGGSAYNCIISNNQTKGSGGGAASSALVNCLVTGNYAMSGGGGLSGGSAYNCIISNNQSIPYGGGASSATLVNCLVIGNSAPRGGGAYGGKLTNCTVVANATSGGDGGGTYGGNCYNCLIWSNTSVNFADGANYYQGLLNSCCTSPMPTNGTGNLVADPQLTDSFHLGPASPCRAAGSSVYATGTDLEGESWLSPPSIGCDEYYARGPLAVSILAPFTNTAGGVPLPITAQVSGSPSSWNWDFGDGTAISNIIGLSHSWADYGDYLVTLTAWNLDYPSGLSASVVIHVVPQPTNYVSQGSPNPVSPYASWATAATNIQDAIDAASTVGGLVLVSNGVYNVGTRFTADPISGGASNRVLSNKRLILRSVNGPIVTAIQGSQATGAPVRCVWLGDGSTLDGFTLTNGGTATKGRRTTSYGAKSSICGGGIWCDTSNALVLNCIIVGNSAGSYGGGVAGGTVSNCLIAQNIANYPFSIFYAGGGGGAMNALLLDCLITGNDTSIGGGAYYSTLVQCTVASNRCGDHGAGIASSTAFNSVVYSNVDAYGENWTQSVFYFCCTFSRYASTSGFGNTTNDPLFVDPANGNFRLQANSPCINAGNNAYVLGSTDLDGNPRISGGTVDIGAYEFQYPASTLSYAWLQKYGLPTDGSADTIDSDHDGLNNFAEWRAGTDPTNAASVLQLLSPTNSGTNLVVTWQSVTNINYYLQRTLGLSPVNFQIIATNIPGWTNSTSYLDTNAPPPGPWFYRIGVQ